MTHMMYFFFIFFCTIHAERKSFKLDQSFFFKKNYVFDHLKDQIFLQQ